MRFHPGLLIVLAASLFVGCRAGSDEITDAYSLQRRHMVRWDLRGRGIKSENVLNAMEAVPRHLFLPARYRKDAYLNQDSPIGHFITTPNPYLAAKMVELLDLKPTNRVLEVGTGSGYQTAVLAELASEVDTIEIVPEVLEQSEKTLRQLGYRNVTCRVGDGYKGWPERKPFDAILISAATKEVPAPLVDQLAMGGRLVMGINGEMDQKLVLYRKTPAGLKEESVMPAKLPRMEGEAVERSFKSE